MKVAKTISAVRKLVTATKKKGKTIGFVPTMGALHQGHISLIEQAAKKTDFIVVSIFVNPTQFGPKEDFNKYPRPVRKDLEICKKAHVDVVFMPSVAQMYPKQNLTWVNIEKLTEPLCGKSRPGHFRGVTTVCSKLFNIVCPDIAFFGQKDAQQAAVIKRMVGDLNMPLKIQVCPTVREADGLAISSRNQYLTPSQRKNAPGIYKALQFGKKMALSGTKKPAEIIAQMRKIINKIPDSKVDYIEIVDADSLQKVEKIASKLLFATVVWVGSTRLIDNIIVDCK